MVLTKSGVSAAILGFALAAVHLSPGYVNQRVLDDSWRWLPRLETAVQTITFYNYALRAAAFVLRIGVVFALGYWAGLRLELRAHARRFVLAVGIGGVLGYGAATTLFVLVVPLVSDGPTLVGPPVLDGAFLLGRAIGAAIPFAVVGFAGAAFADGEIPTRSGD